MNNMIRILILIFLLLTISLSQTHPAPPDIPEIQASYGHEKITLTWDKKAEGSIDPLTGYSDFEGYRIYKSTDGGVTWGKSWNRIYDYDGNQVGWKPFEKYDLNEYSDSLHCIYKNAYYNSAEGERCYSIGYSPSSIDSISLADEAAIFNEDSSLVFLPRYIRNLDVSEFDPMATWFNLGENSGISNTIVDTNVIDGVEYTYAITAYDMGMRTYSLKFIDEVIVDETTTVTDGIFVSDTTWASSNPDKHLGIDELGYPSFESPRLFESFTDFNANGICDNNEPFNDLDSSDANENGLCDDDGDWNLRINPINVITIQAGYKASNITYPENDFIVPDSTNVGNGERLYNIVNESELSKSIIRFEIDAGLDPNSFGNSTIGSFATLNPALYAFEAISNNNYSPKSTYDVSVEDFDEDSLNTILGLPGVDFDSETGLVSIPEYKLEDFKLTYVSDPLFESQWTGWFDGIQFRFDNGPNNLDGNPLALVEIKKITYSDTALSNFMNVKMRYKNKNDLPLRPMFNYRIDFSSTILDTAYQVVGNGCNALPDINTQLPFRVTNLTTGRQVKVQHLDKGMESAKINYGELSAGGGCIPVCSSNETCIDDGTGDPKCHTSTGYKNCMWEFDESLVLIDTVYTSNDLGGNDEKVYNLKIGMSPLDGSRFFEQRTGLNFLEMTNEDWIEMIWPWGGPYDSLDMIFYGGMLYQATEDVSIYSNTPDEWFDNDGDDINDNPWQMLYPWNDSDYVIIEPYGWYKDGDAWVVDMSEIGAIDDDSSNDLDKIKVVPNPFIGNSNYFNESPGNSLIRFTHLPKKCTISIYTISGEFVTSITHDADFDGSEWWDVRNGRGQEIAPGLYIYVVETPTGEKKIDKFAVVR